MSTTSIYTIKPNITTDASDASFFQDIVSMNELYKIKLTLDYGIPYYELYLNDILPKSEITGFKNEKKWIVSQNETLFNPTFGIIPPIFEITLRIIKKKEHNTIYTVYKHLLDTINKITILKNNETYNDNIRPFIREFIRRYDYFSIYKNDKARKEIHKSTSNLLGPVAIVHFMYVTYVGDTVYDTIYSTVYDSRNERLKKKIATLDPSKPLITTRELPEGESKSNYTVIDDDTKFTKKEQLILTRARQEYETKNKLISERAYIFNSSDLDKVEAMDVLPYMKEKPVKEKILPRVSISPVSQKNNNSTTIMPLFQEIKQDPISGTLKLTEQQHHTSSPTQQQQQQFQTEQDLELISYQYNNLIENIDELANYYNDIQPPSILFSLYFYRKFKNIVCFPIMFEKGITINNISWTIEEGRRDEGKLSINMELIKQCLEGNQKNKQFIIIDVFLNYNSNDRRRDSSHANVILFNKKSKTLERFEPNSNILPSGSSNIFNINEFDKQLVKKFKEHGIVAESHDIDICIKLNIEGPQRLQKKAEQNYPPKKKYRGNCLFWSIWFIHLRLKYPCETSEDLLNKALALLNNKPDKLNGYIYNYMTFIFEMEQEFVKQLGFMPSNTYLSAENRAYLKQSKIRRNNAATSTSTTTTIDSDYMDIPIVLIALKKIIKRELGIPYNTTSLPVDLTAFNPDDYSETQKVEDISRKGKKVKVKNKVRK